VKIVGENEMMVGEIETFKGNSQKGQFSRMVTPYQRPPTSAETMRDHTPGPQPNWKEDLGSRRRAGLQNVLQDEAAKKDHVILQSAN